MGVKLKKVYGFRCENQYHFSSFACEAIVGLPTEIELYPLLK